MIYYVVRSNKVDITVLMSMGTGQNEYVTRMCIVVLVDITCTVYSILYLIYCYIGYSCTYIYDHFLSQRGLQYRRAKEVYVTEAVYDILYTSFFSPGCEVRRARSMVQIERTVISIQRDSFDYNERRPNVIR